jgi:hypothetical protein
MNRARACLMPLFLGLFLVSCSSTTDPGPNNAPKSVEQSAPASSAAPSPVQSAPPSATPLAIAKSTAVNSNIGVQKLTLTSKDGYVANIELKWHEVAIVDQVSLGCEKPSGSNLITKAVVVKGTVSYPVVNGITPPAALEAGFVASPVKPVSEQLVCSSAGYNYQHLSLPTVKEAAGSTADFTLVIGEVSSKTPNNPNGKFTDYYKTVELTTNFGGNCTYQGPGVRSASAPPSNCVVSIPQ